LLVSARAKSAVEQTYLPSTELKPDTSVGAVGAISRASQRARRLTSSAAKASVTACTWSWTSRSHGAAIQRLSPGDIERLGMKGGRFYYERHAHVYLIVRHDCRGVRFGKRVYGSQWQCGLVPGRGSAGTACRCFSLRHALLTVCEQSIARLLTTSADVLAAVSEGDHSRLLELTEDFMATAQATARAPWFLRAPADRQHQNVHRALRMEVSAHSEPQPYNRTTALVCDPHAAACLLR